MVELIIVKARIELVRTENGGRQTGIKTGYRPNHVFEQVANFTQLKAYIGDIQFDSQETIQPGASEIVTVRFLRNPIVENYIRVGQQWFIHEGPRLVGYGTILEI